MLFVILIEVLLEEMDQVALNSCKISPVLIHKHNLQSEVQVSMTLEQLQVRNSCC